jgi:hypothetical protein
MTVDWQLPGSKFELVLYGQDWEDVEGREVGDRCFFDIVKGGLKEGKSGNYASDHFWNLSVIDAQRSTVKAAPVQKPAPAPAAAPSGVSQAPERSIDQRIAWNSAINNATNLFAQRWPPAAPGADWGEDVVNMQNLIMGWAAWYYAAIVAGPPQEQAQDDATEAAQPPAAPELPRTPAERPNMAQCPLKAHGGAPMRVMPQFQDQRPCHPVNIMEGGKQVLSHWCWGEVAA